VIYVIRASKNSFELRWKEQTYESGTIAKTEYFTGIAEVIFKSASTAETLRNPLGLHVHTLAWLRD
jgi:type IV secretion system protein VirB5